MAERNLQKQVLRKLRERYPSAQFRVLHGTVYAHRGDPDIYGCIGGRMIQIETKISGNKPSPLQEKRIRDWEAAGAISFAAWSWDDVESELRRHGL